MRNRVSICTLIIGLICLFTQVARGQKSGPAQPAPSGMIGERSEGAAGRPSESGRRMPLHFGIGVHRSGGRT